MRTTEIWFVLKGWNFDLTLGAMEYYARLGDRRIGSGQTNGRIMEHIRVKDILRL